LPASCILEHRIAFIFLLNLSYIFLSVRNKRVGGRMGQTPKSMRDPCKVVICRDPGSVP